MSFVSGSGGGGGVLGDGEEVLGVARLLPEDRLVGVGVSSVISQSTLSLKSSQFVSTVELTEKKNHASITYTHSLGHYVPVK